MSQSQMVHGVESFELHEIETHVDKLGRNYGSRDLVIKLNDGHDIRITLFSDKFGEGADEWTKADAIRALMRREKS